MKKNFFVLIMIMSLLASSISFVAINVNAQTQGTVTMLDSLGGTTNPSAGTQTYNDGATVTLTANTQNSFAFLFWVISNVTTSTIDSKNPTTLTVQAGDNYTIQPVFTPIQTSQLGVNSTTNPADGIIVVLTSVGGTTNPAPGHYAVSSLKQTTLTAIPDSGWQFSHWIISGFPMQGAHGNYSFTATPTDNPYTVGHGEGNTYNYQAVFTPVGTTEPTPTATATPATVMGGISTDTAIIIVLSVVVVLLVIALGLVAMRKRKR
jgi:hypothetical protein